MGALQGWHVGIEQGFPLGIYWGHWAEDHVSQEGGLGQGEWQEHAQPGEMGPRGRGGVWSLWGSVSPGWLCSPHCCHVSVLSHIIPFAAWTNLQWRAL